MPKKIDLNCDLGEFFQTENELRDRKIMPLISSCNIACGFHAGNPLTIKKTIQLALEHNVAIGAHPSWPDRDGFGRKEMNLSAEELEAVVMYQIAALKGMTEACGGKLHHIKPHGALYNQAAKNEAIATGIVKAIVRTQNNMLLYAPVNSVLSKLATDAGVKVRSEVFADRRYEDDLSLRSRSLEGAMLHKKEEVLEQLSNFLEGCVLTQGGHRKNITAETICLHSDTEGATELAMIIRKFLERYEVEITAY